MILKYLLPKMSTPIFGVTNVFSFTTPLKAKTKPVTKP